MWCHIVLYIRVIYGYITFGRSVNLYGTRKDIKMMEELELLITANTEYEIGVISNILEDNNIPFVIKDAGSGGYMRIYSGSSIYGTDILVRKDFLEKAKDLIGNFL